MNKASLRHIPLFAFLISLCLIGFSYWLELHDAIVPCALCSLQRYVVILLSIAYFIEILIVQNQRYLHLLAACLTAVISLLGAWLAGRQIWLQWLPPSKSHAGCGVSLNYLFKMLPFDKALTQAVNGSAECATVSWTFLHMSLAEWTLLFFALFFVLSLMQGRKALR